MPDLSGSLSHEESWSSPGSSEVVLAQLVDALRQIDGNITALGRYRAVATLGSRRVYRLMGLMTPIEKRPIKIYIATRSFNPSTVRVTVICTTNEGRYLGEMPIGVSQLDQRHCRKTQFQSSFSAVCKHLRDASPPMELAG